MRLITTMLALLLASGGAWAQSYVCSFGPEIQVVEADLENPKVEIKKRRNQEAGGYTFVTQDKNKGTYLNDSHKIPSPVAVMRNGATMMFTEINSSDNHFVVTVFLDKRTPENKRPALISTHSVGRGAGDFYHPSISLGSCRIYN